MADDVDQVAADDGNSLKSWIKPELTRVEFGEAESGPNPSLADAGSGS